MEIKKQKIQDKLFLFVMDLLFTKYERASVRVIEYQVIEMVKQKIQDKEGIHIKECWAG